MSEQPTPVQDLPYAVAVEELERILAELEADELDIDHLADKVGRAAALIRECRDRIAATRFEVERIVADLHPQPGAGSSDEVAPGAGAGA